MHARLPTSNANRSPSGSWADPSNKTDFKTALISLMVVSVRRGIVPYDCICPRDTLVIRGAQDPERGLLYFWLYNNFADKGEPYELFQFQ